MSESRNHNKQIVSLLVQAFCRKDLTVFDSLYTVRAAPKARAWVRPFLDSFPDVTMDIVQMISEGDTVVARFRCSGTHLGLWQGHLPSGKRFERVDEVYFFTFRNGLIDGGWGIEDNLTRLRQLGFSPDAQGPNDASND
jgi:predicted ester cyclase